MARARVMLQEALTYTRGGKTWKRNEPEILTNASEIEYLRNTGRFAVSDLDDRPPKQKAVASPDQLEDEHTEPADEPEAKTAKRGRPRKKR